MIYILLAEGFEEVEALAPADCLRRAGAQVALVGVTGKTVTGSHGITVTADTESVDFESCELLMLPGGSRGVENLEKSAMVSQALRACSGGRIAAICAAPSILGKAGMLAGHRATCYPGFEQYLYDAQYTGEGVVTDRLITTGKSVGHSISFGLELVRLLFGDRKAEEVRSKMLP